MTSRRPSGGGDSTEETDASGLGDAFQTIARGLAHLQDALRLQEQEAERRLQEALRLQEQRAASALSVAMQQEEQKLQEKRVQLRVREAEERKARARASPCPLGEDLCKAVLMGKLNDIRRLLVSGADVNYINGTGWTPLMFACSGLSNVQTASLILEEGADANTVDEIGCCALHIASVGNEDCVPVLIRAGADVDARDVNGATPLHRAALNSNEMAVRVLVAAGARRDLKGWGGDFKDKTPFDVAESAALRHLLRP